MKQLLLLVILLSCTFFVKAQDAIHLKDGTVIEAYIKKITKSMIYYSATRSSPQRFIKKSAVEKVVYKRGREVMMETPQSMAQKKRKQSLENAHNMFTIAPLPLMFWGRYSGIGLGADYERFIGQRHFISFHIPVYVGLIGTERSEVFNDYNEATIFYASPGIRFHLLNPQSKLDYAIGVSGIIGNANHTEYYELYSSIDQQFLLTGVTLDNDINFTHPRRKIILGVHTAVGPVFGDFSKDGKWMVQIGIKVGRRF